MLKNCSRDQPYSLDRDGVINHDASDYPYKYKDFKFRPGVIEGIRTVNKKKLLYLFIITNQAGISEKVSSQEREFY